MEYSLVELFGELPVSPDKFKELDPKLKWLGNAVEGNSFCTMCGTLSPKMPRAHHVDCCSYSNADSYPEHENPLGKCPDCNSDDLGLTSCREAGLSIIECSDCGYRYSDSVPEEDLKERFLAQER